MANIRFWLDEVMNANDSELQKPVPGYQFSNGRQFFGENDGPGSFKYATVTPDGDVAKAATQKLGIFQGTPWLDSVGVWDDTQRWVDG